MYIYSYIYYGVCGSAVKFIDIFFVSSTFSFVLHSGSPHLKVHKSCPFENKRTQKQNKCVAVIIMYNVMTIATKETSNDCKQTIN